ncbi:unnamed protein product, partial [Ectocarpus sp. 12 AP-2014]
PREAAEALIRKGYAQGGSSRPGQPASGGTGGAAAGAPMKRRRWYLGIQSKKDPAHVMTEVYRALLQLGCEWHLHSSYRIQCMWKPDAEPGGQGTGGDRLGTVGTGRWAEEYRVVAGLTLYKVQTNIYLLDFHKRQGDQFT